MISQVRDLYDMQFMHGRLHGLFSQKKGEGGAGTSKSAYKITFKPYKTAF
jgi:hypothetical protein